MDHPTTGRDNTTNVMLPIRSNSVLKFGHGRSDELVVEVSLVAADTENWICESSASDMRATLGDCKNALKGLFVRGLHGVPIQASGSGAARACVRFVFQRFFFFRDVYGLLVGDVAENTSLSNSSCRRGHANSC